MKLHSIELLAPARNYEAGCAAVDYGADALYVGGPGFGARAAAANSLEQVARLVQYARTFGVRVYATLNTLAYEAELARAERTARDLIAAGVDALIVQDMAFLRMGLQGVEFHASTQTQNVTPKKVRFLEQCGFSRVILERGLTLTQIKAIRAATQVDLEAFVHGAICVGYSGRCYLSRSMSTRSGNRGECAQPCRLPYDLEDGMGQTILKNKHLLSLRDLNLAARIPELLATGVTSFKIEGRLKDTAYVKNVVACYRGVIDRAMGEGMARASEGRTIVDFMPDPARSFTRGATSYYFDGKAAGAASFDTPKAVGTPIGRVESVTRDSFRLDSGSDTAPGDGICFRTASGELQGTNINRVESERIFPNRMEGITPGTEIFRNYDHAFTKALERSRTRRVIDLRASVRFDAQGLELTLEDGSGNRVIACHEGASEAARDVQAMRQTIQTQIRKNGEMPFQVGAVEIEGPVGFVPVSRLNELRREAMTGLLDTLRRRTPPRFIAAADQTVCYPADVVDGYANVTNSLAEAFYRDHGTTHFTPGYDLAQSLAGVELLRTPYCIRREIGQCLRERHTLAGPLTLRHGKSAYELCFDCEACEMTIKIRE